MTLGGAHGYSLDQGHINFNMEDSVPQAFGLCVWCKESHMAGGGWTGWCEKYFCHRRRSVMDSFMSI